MMRVLALFCSPYRGGNSDILAARFLSALTHAEVERVFVSDLKIEPCRSCRACNTTGRCILQDDAPPLYEKIVSAEVLLFATPCHMGGLPSTAQALVERAQFLWARNYLLGLPPPTRTAGNRPRRLYAILTGGQRDPKTRSGVLYILSIWGRHVGAHLAAALDAGGLHEHGDVREREDLLQRAHLLGRSSLYPYFT